MQWLGYYFGILHIFITTSLITLVVLSQVFIRKRWLKTFVFLFIVAIVVQHLVLGDCVVTVLEKKLTGQEQAPFHMITEQFMVSIGLTMDHYWKYTPPIEKAMFLFLGLELMYLYLA